MTELPPPPSPFAPPTTPTPARMQAAGTKSGAATDLGREQAADALADSEARCRHSFALAVWRAQWNERHRDSLGHEAARRGIEACLEAGRLCLERGEFETVHAIAALALRVADGTEFERGRRWTATEGDVDIVDPADAEATRDG